MGQKVHPTGVRVGIIKDWNSKWYADSRNFADYLVEDQTIRKFLKNKLYTAGISKIEIERTAKFVRINVYAAKPGIIIGKGVDDRREIIDPTEIRPYPERPLMVLGNGEDGIVRHVVKPVIQEPGGFFLAVEAQQPLVATHDKLVVGVFDDGLDVERFIVQIA